MKHVIKAAGIAVVLSGWGSMPALADSGCIPSDKIDHTTVMDDQAVLFVMRNHTVWKNTLESRCVGLKLDPGGFTYTVTVPETRQLCKRATIHLNRTGQPCLLGDFTQVEPAKTAAQ